MSRSHTLILVFLALVPCLFLSPLAQKVWSDDTVQDSSLPRIEGELERTMPGDGDQGVIEGELERSISGECTPGIGKRTKLGIMEPEHCTFEEKVAHSTLTWERAMDDPCIKCRYRQDVEDHYHPGSSTVTCEVVDLISKVSYHYAIKDSIQNVNMPDIFLFSIDHDFVLFDQGCLYTHYIDSEHTMLAGYSVETPYQANMRIHSNSLDGKVGIRCGSQYTSQPFSSPTANMDYSWQGGKFHTLFSCASNSLDPKYQLNKTSFQAYTHHSIELNVTPDIPTGCEDCSQQPYPMARAFVQASNPMCEDLGLPELVENDKWLVYDFTPQDFEYLSPLVTDTALSKGEFSASGQLWILFDNETRKKKKQDPGKPLQGIDIDVSVCGRDLDCAVDLVVESLILQLCDQDCMLDCFSLSGEAQAECMSKLASCMACRFGVASARDEYADWLCREHGVCP